jgi:hypothetical protein
MNSFLFGCAVTCLSTAVLAQTGNPPSQNETRSPVAHDTRALEDLMAQQQTHHLKLWFAGLQNFWELAAYEFDKLKLGLDETAKISPTFNNAPVAQLVDAMNRRELLEVANAIAARDRETFIPAFDRMTAACNACHQETGRGFIVMRRPATAPYSNQLLTPMQPR